MWDFMDSRPKREPISKIGKLEKKIKKLEKKSNYIPLFGENLKDKEIKDRFQAIAKTKPEQYQIGIDTFERVESNLTKEEILAICKFNIDKYTWRKKGQDIEDFEKIIDYANFAIKQLKK